MSYRKVIMTADEIMELSKDFVQRECYHRKARRFNNAVEDLRELLLGCSCDPKTGEVSMYDGTISALKELYNAAIWDGKS